MNTTRDMAGGTLIVLLAVILLAAVGWVRNLMALSDYDFEPSYRAEVIRLVGVFVPPAGAVMGFLDIEDGETDS